MNVCECVSICYSFTPKLLKICPGIHAGEVEGIPGSYFLVSFYSQDAIYELLKDIVKLDYYFLKEKEHMLSFCQIFHECLIVRPIII